MRNDKVLLRPIENTDLDKLNKWKNDKEVFKFLGGGFKPTSRIEQMNWIESMAIMSSTQRFIICDVSNNDAIGLIGLYDINFVNRTAEVGLYIGERFSQGQGFGKNSYFLIEQYAKNCLNLRKLKLNVVDSNLAGKSFWEKNEFDIIGLLSKERFVDGEYLDLLIMEKFLDRE